MSLIERNKENDPLFTIQPIYSENHFLNLKVKQIKSLDEKDLKRYRNTLRKYLLDLFEKENIPPGAVSKSLKSIIEKLKKFDRNDYEKVIDGDFFTHGNSDGIVVNHWFPEIFKTKVSSAGNIIESLQNEKRFESIFRRNVIENKMRFYERIDDNVQLIEDEIAGSNERLYPIFTTILRLANGNQTVVNFPPFLAKVIYRQFLKEFKNDKELYVYDPSMGWAGRLLGLLSASQYFIDKKINFIGTDVNDEISPHRYQKIVNFFDENIRSIVNIDFSFNCHPAEEMNDIEKFRSFYGKGHLAFSSPPYFNKELYGNENQKQSHTRYKQYSSWRDGFLKPMIKNVYSFLRPGGYLLLNIANIRKGKNVFPLKQDSIDYGNEIGLIFQKEQYLLFATAVGNNRNKKEEQFEKEKELKIRELKKSKNNCEIKEDVFKIDKQIQEIGDSQFQEKALKDSVKYNGKWKKYEPLLIFKKEV